MTLFTLIYLRLKNLPVTVLLTLSCLAISIPLLISPELYTVLGYDDELKNRFWQLITSSFAHGCPGCTAIPPVPHLLGNLLVIVLLGALIERILGSGRFFILTLVTFATHTIWKVLCGGGNGASGFCWGYVVFAAPVLFWEWQRRKKQILKDPLYIGMVVFSAFMVFGVATVLWIGGFGPWNGSNQAHIVSILTALPFVFLWRDDLRQNWQNLTSHQPIDSDPVHLNSVAIGASIVLLLFNLILAGTAINWLNTGAVSPPRIMSMTPQSGDVETLNQFHQQITIRFDKPMESDVNLKRLSIDWLDEKGKLDYTTHWVDPQTLVFVFSRKVYESENILIITYVRDERWGMVIPIEIRFQ